MSAWEALPVILCESCADNGVHTEAAYLLPQTGGVVAIVCEGHAEDWFEEDTDGLIHAARRLRDLSFPEREYVTNERRA